MRKLLEIVHLFNCYFVLYFEGCLNNLKKFSLATHWQQKTRLLNNRKIKNCFLKTSLLLTILVTSLQANAQTYPVQVTPQIVPPYSIKLSDYATTTSEKLFVNLLLTDINEIGRRVRLKMQIKGQGLTIISNDLIIGETPIFLDGGVNLRLSNLDLQAYFRQNNLTGITPQRFNTPLPNGPYEFCFEVYDYFTNRKISNNGCTTIYLIQNDPPILNLPFRDNVVTAMNPQNVIFTWTPRHTNAPNVQYEFTLKELWDIQNPQANFLGSVPFYQTTTQSTTLLVGPEAPQMLSGKMYGWQVRAFVSDGVEETAVFKNDGKSEIFWFRYLEDCTSPSFVISQALNSESVRVNWQLSDHIKYQIQYRKKGFGEADWFSTESYTNEGTIYNLEPNTIYEFRVGGECTPLSGYAYSNIQEFTTPSNDEAAYYNCGFTPEIDISNTDPLPSLKPNDTFTAGDFPVVVREVSGGNGVFSGWGYVTLPFLENIKEIIDAVNIATGAATNEEGGGDVNVGKYTRIKVAFEGIEINTSKQLIQGVVVTDYDPTWSGIIDLDESSDEVLELIDDVFGDDPSDDPSTSDNSDVTDNETQVEDSVENQEETPPSDTPNTPDTPVTSEDPPPPGGGNPPQDTSDDPPQEGSNDDNNELVIEYKNKDYSDKDIITIPFNRKLEKQNFILKNVKEDSRIEWSFHKSFDAVSVEKSLGQGKSKKIDVVNDINETIVLQAEYWDEKSDYPNDNSKKIRVKLNIPRKKFEFEDLLALHKESRLAKSGQVLYLVEPPNLSEFYHQEVKFGIKISPKVYKNEIRKTDIEWNFDGINSFDNYGDKNIKRSLRFRNIKYVTSSITGYQNQIERSVDVKWVKHDYIDTKLPVLESAKEFIGGFETATRRLVFVLDAITGCETTIKPIVFSYKRASYNEEDDDSRFYNRKYRNDFILSNSFGTECMVRGTSVKIGKFKVGLLLKAGFEFDGTYRREWFKVLDQGEDKEVKSVYQATGSLKLGAGLKGDVIDTKYFTLKGEATVNGGGHIRFVTKKNNTLYDLYAEMKPVTLKLKGKVKVVVGGYEFEQEIEKNWRLYKNDKRFEIYKDKKLPFINN